MKRFKLYWFFRKLYDKYLRKKDESLIPEGVYCHTHREQGLYCPYWDTNPYAPKQEFGYCSYLAEGDWESDKLSLLWDACKECGIREGLEDE
jgi:hypothetical protein